MNLTQIKLMSYDEIFEYVLSEYIKKYGERRLKKVFEKVMTSNKISGMISTSNYRMISLGSKDFIYCLNEIPYFMFSSGQTQAVAALIALHRWNQEVNSHQHLISNDGLQLRAVNILEELKTTFF